MNNELTIENIKKEVEGRNIVDVSVVFNPLMEEYMGYRKAFIQKAINKEEFKNLVETFIKQDKFYDLYEKAITVSKIETESEEISQWA